MDVNISKGKYISVWIDLENFIYARWRSIRKSAKEEDGGR